MAVFQPNRPAYQQDPYPFLHRLRAAEPVHRSREIGAWIITSYAGALRVLTDDGHFSPDPAHAHSELGDVVRHIRASAPLGDVPILGSSDPPDHTRLRAVVNRAFTPRALAAFEPEIATMVSDFVGRWPAGQPVDVMSAFAQPLAALGVLAYLGVPPDGLSQVSDWSSAIMAARAGEAVSPADLTAARQARVELEAYLRAERPGGVLGELLNAEEQGQISFDDLVLLAIHISFAGNGPTAFAIGNALLALATHPDQFATLRADLSLVPGAVEECLRFDTPTHIVHRFVTAPTELGGRKLLAGETVAVVIGAANRDPERFSDPDAFDITRDTGGQLAFGHGIHFCLGAPLARLELAAVLRSVATRFTSLTVAPDGLRRGDTFLLRGPAALRLVGE